MNISLEAYEVLKQEYQRQASHYTDAFTPFDGLFEVVGMVLYEIEHSNSTPQRVLFDKEEDEDWADMNRSVMADLLKQHQPYSMKE